MEDENQSQQICELESLESIYTKELKILVPEKEFMIDVQLDIQSSIRVSLYETMMATTAAHTLPSVPLTNRSVSLPSLRNAIVSHLPPVTLYVRYNEHYPSHEQPHRHLSARWLNPALTDRMKPALDAIFIPGYPVVFDWVNYISSNLINDYCDLLAKHNDQSLEESSPICNEPRPTEPHPSQLLVRSISEFNDIEEYDHYETHREFLLSSHECSICFETKQGELFSDRCADCEGPGLYCRECVSQYCQMLINEGRVNAITCPYPSCNVVFADTSLQQMLNQKTFDKYVTLREQMQLNLIPGMVYCPRTVCNSYIISDPDSDLAVCDTCGFPFCKLCRQTWHGLGRCTVFDKIKDTDEVAANDSSVDTKIDSKETKNRMEELKSMVWFRTHSDVRSCPNCTMVIQKTGGCNKMTCWKCGCGFCWLCNEKCFGYGHFTPGRCELMKTEVIVQDEAATQKVLANKEEILEQLIHKKCPRCSQVYRKDTNKNWVMCSKCKMQFCLMCREPCYGQYHFNEYGCKRFSTLKDDMKLMEENN